MSNVAIVSHFRWTARKDAVAVALAAGHTQQAVADRCGITRRTVQRWLDDPVFGAEVDRLTLMLDIAGRAARVRLAKRIVNDRLRDGRIETRRDLLNWLKFVQSETDGVRLGLAPMVETQSAERS